MRHGLPSNVVLPSDGDQSKTDSELWTFDYQVLCRLQQSESQVGFNEWNSKGLKLELLNSGCSGGAVAEWSKALLLREKIN